jgi:hypothetical protein
MSADAVTNDPSSLALLVDEELKLRFSAAALERNLKLLEEANVHVSLNTFNLSQAKANWSAITRSAEQGKATVIEREGKKLVLIAAEKLFDVAETSREARAFGDMLDAYRAARQRRVRNATGSSVT